MSESMEAINERLSRLLQSPPACTSDVARALGFKIHAYFMRLKREAVPVDEIKALCKKNGYSSEYVLYGRGPAFVEGTYGEQKKATRDFFLLRLKAMGATDEVSSFVMDIVDALLKGDEAELKKALRNRFRISAAEARLLCAYRKADTADRARISSMATSLATKASAE